MGISRLVDDEDAECSELRLSHAVQRLMFWAEAGRNAFKDDGKLLIYSIKWCNILT